MADEWYCKIGPTEFGPLSAKHLTGLALGGQLLPDHLVRKGTTGSWTPAEHVKGLKFQAANAALAAKVVPGKPSFAVDSPLIANRNESPVAEVTVPIDTSPATGRPTFAAEELLATSFVACPNCRGSFAFDPRLAGLAATCPYCRRPVLMPALPLRIAAVGSMPAITVPRAEMASIAASPIYPIGFGPPASVPQNPFAGAGPAIIPVSDGVGAIVTPGSVSTNGLGGAKASCYFTASERVPGLRKKLRETLATHLTDEGVAFTIQHVPPDQSVTLETCDVLIRTRVLRFEYGDRFTRYFLTFVSLFGPGSCRLKLHVDLTDGRGQKRSYEAHARQWIGIFGGSNDGLMRLNVKLVSGHIGRVLARHVAMRWFTNHQVYDLTLASLIFSLLGLVCLPFFPVGLVTSAIAFAFIWQRKLPRRRGMAIGALAVAGITTLLWIVVFLAVALSSH